MNFTFNKNKCKAFYLSHFNSLNSSRCVSQHPQRSIQITFSQSQARDYLVFIWVLPQKNNLGCSYSQCFFFVLRTSTSSMTQYTWFILTFTSRTLEFGEFLHKTVRHVCPKYTACKTIQTQVSNNNFYTFAHWATLEFS